LGIVLFEDTVDKIVEDVLEDLRGAVVHCDSFYAVVFVSVDSLLVA
jgi:hypothetical protein